MSPDSPRKPQFSLKMMFLVTTIVAMAMAGWGGMRRGGEDRIYFILFTAAVPLIAVVVLGIAHQISRWRRPR